VAWVCLRPARRAAADYLALVAETALEVDTEKARLRICFISSAYLVVRDERRGFVGFIWSSTSNVMADAPGAALEALGLRGRPVTSMSSIDDPEFNLPTSKEPARRPLGLARRSFISLTFIARVFGNEPRLLGGRWVSGLEVLRRVVSGLSPGVPPPLCPASVLLLRPPPSPAYMLKRRSRDWPRLRGEPDLRAERMEPGDE
jgi:hypothetical protein